MVHESAARRPSIRVRVSAVSRIPREKTDLPLWRTGFPSLSSLGRTGRREPSDVSYRYIPKGSPAVVEVQVHEAGRREGSQALDMRRCHLKTAQAYGYPH